MFRKFVEVLAATVLLVVLSVAMVAAYEYGQADTYHVFYSENDNEATRVVDPNGEDVSDPQGWWVKNKDNAKYEITYVAPQWLREKIAAESK